MLRLMLYLVRRLSTLRRSHKIPRRSYWLALGNQFCWWILRLLMVLWFQSWRLEQLTQCFEPHWPWMVLHVWISLFFSFVIPLCSSPLSFFSLFYPIVPHTGSDNGDCGWKNGQFISIKKIQNEFLEKTHFFLYLYFNYW
jgi:hypothetical protein